MIYFFLDYNSILNLSDTNTGEATQLMQLVTPNGESFTGISGAEGFFYGIVGSCEVKQTLFTVSTEGSVEIIGELPSDACAIDLA